MTSLVEPSCTAPGEEDEDGFDMPDTEALGASASDEESVARAGEFTTGAQAVGRRAHDEVREGAQPRSKGRETAKACMMMEIATEGAADGTGGKEEACGPRGYGRRRWGDDGRLAGLWGKSSLAVLLSCKSQHCELRNFLGLVHRSHLPTAGETNIVRLSIIYTWLIYPIVSRHLAY